MNLNVEVNEPDFGAYLNWLHFGEATLTFPQTIVLRYSRFEPAERRLPQVVADYTRWFLSRLRGIDSVLQHHDFLCAQRFTAADVSVGYALMLATYLGLEERFSAAIRDYWYRLQSREGFQRALAAQERAAQAQGVPLVAAPETGAAS
jgi:glutathione S-transferase